MKKWYNFETMFSSLKSGLIAFLKENNIRYELSDGRTQYDTAMVWHFEIEASEEEARAVNAYLDSVTI